MVSYIIWLLTTESLSSFKWKLIACQAIKFTLCKKTTLASLVIAVHDALWYSSSSPILQRDGNMNLVWASSSFTFCSVIDLISKQEFLQGHPSLLASAELNLLTCCYQPVMWDFCHKYWPCKQLFKLVFPLPFLWKKFK